MIMSTPTTIKAIPIVFVDMIVSFLRLDFQRR
jgi:hypothetical protein